MPPIHTREWFRERIEQARTEVGQWPGWMQGQTTVVASFPLVGELQTAEDSRRSNITRKSPKQIKTK